MKHTIQLFAITTLLLTMCACQKEGDIEVAPQYAEWTVKLDYASNPGAVYKVTIQDELITDSLSYGGSKLVKTTAVIRQSNPHFEVFDMATRKLLADTTLQLLPKDVVTIIQLSEDEPLIIQTSQGGGSGEGEAPDSNLTKVRFLYQADVFPDSIYVELVSADPTGFDYDYSKLEQMHFDTIGKVKLLKGNVSGYITYDYNRYNSKMNSLDFYNIYDAKDGGLILQGNALNDYYSPEFSCYGVIWNLPSATDKFYAYYKFMTLKLNAVTYDGVGTFYNDEFLFGEKW